MTPTISVIIPTLNAQKALKLCLVSIRRQNYSQSKLKIIIADGGSTDSTLKIAQKYNCQIIANKLKTGEAGKAVGLAKAKGEFIALIDSDNILPHKNWLKQMIQPLLAHPQAIGSEPWAFTYRPQAGFIERYCSLVGANDPYAFITGQSDRLNHINQKWTTLPVPQKNFSVYLLVTLKPNRPLPTLGANGTVFRHSFLKKYQPDQYFFDIDIISHALKTSKKPLQFIKTKNSIIHTYCESSIIKFIKKQHRRLTDYYHYQNLRQFNWQQNNHKTKFILHTVFISPILTFLGFIKKPDFAWFFHPLGCWLTLIIYLNVSLQHSLGLLKPLNRQQWQQ